MWTWVAIFVCALLTFWHAKLRTHSCYDRRPLYRSACAVTDDIRQVDYVVIGAGPGGLAACQSLLRRIAGIDRVECAGGESTVLLVEPGHDLLASTPLGELWETTASKQRLLCFAPECVVTGMPAVPPSLSTPLGMDEGCVTRRPFRPPLPEADEAVGETAEESAKVRQRRERNRQLLYTSYPRGRGVGGGSLLDWGLVVKTTAPCTPVAHDGAPQMPDMSTQPDVAQTSPLSWTFRDAVKSVLAKHKPIATDAEAEPWSLGSVFRSTVRVDQNGRRLPLSAALLDGMSPSLLRRLTVLTGHRVVRLVVDPATDPAALSTTVCEVLVQSQRSSAEAVSIRVRKGVVLAAGAVHSPRLLYDTFSVSPMTLHRECGVQCGVPRGVPPPRVAVRDCLALPFVTKVHMRVSADRVNLCDAKNSVMYWFAQRGAYLSPFADSVASVPLPKLGPRAELLIVLLPLGGRDGALYQRLGWDRILGSFPEAMTMLLILNGVSGLGFELPLESPTPSDAAASLPPRPCVSVDSPVTMPEPMTRAVREAFREGMHLCREVVTAAPLDYLTPGTEAVDVTLLKQDPKKAMRLAQLTHTPTKHLTVSRKRELAELTTWALCVAKTTEYEDAYIDQHAYWLGFASASSARFLQDGNRVMGLQNVFVGDTSCVADEGDQAASLFSGSVTCAMEAGYRAAEALTAPRI